MVDATDDDDTWMASMFDLQADLAKRSINECSRLRCRVRELEGLLSIGSTAALMEMQDRISQLEQLLKQARAGVQTDGAAPERAPSTKGPDHG